MITREEFAEIMICLKNRYDVCTKVDDIFRESSDYLPNDGANLVISNEDIVVKLLENMFNDTDNISWWIYEKDYGRDDRMKMWDKHGKEIDVSTPEKLYDYLIKTRREK